MPRYSEHDPRSLWRRMLAWPRMGWFLLLGGMSAASQWFERMLRAIGRKTGFLSRVVEQSDTVMAGLGRAVAPTKSVAGRWLFHLDRLIPAPLARGSVRMLRWLGYPFAASAGFLFAFLATRPRSIWRWTFPLVAIAVPVLAMALLPWLQGKGGLTENYRRALLVAIEKGDYPQARLYQDKLQQLGSNSLLLSLETADDLVSRGEWNEAYQMVELLAPRESPGLGMAHFWMARRLAQNPGPWPADEALELALIHLGHARTGLGSDLPNLDYLEALIHVKRNRPELAAPLLAASYERWLPSAAMKLEMDVASGRSGEATLSARALLRQLQSDPQLARDADQALFRIWWKAEALAGTGEGAREVCRLWLERFPENEEARLLAIRSHLDAIDQALGSLETASVEKTGRLILTAGRLLTLPERGSLASRLAALFRKPAPASAMALVDWLENQKEVPGLVLESLGTAAIVAGEPERARRLLERATREIPDDHHSWNNLAYLLNRSFPDQLDNALAAATRAVELAPNQWDTRNTKGVVLSAMKRWREAVDEWNVAVSLRPASPEVHAALAIAWRELGDAGQAARHQQLAEQARVSR